MEIWLKCCEGIWPRYHHFTAGGKWSGSFLCPYSGFFPRTFSHLIAQWLQGGVICICQTLCCSSSEVLFNKNAGLLTRHLSIPYAFCPPCDSYRAQYKHRYGSFNCNTHGRCNECCGSRHEIAASAHRQVTCQWTCKYHHGFHVSRRGSVQTISTYNIPYSRYKGAQLLWGFFSLTQLRKTCFSSLALELGGGISDKNKAKVWADDYVDLSLLLSVTPSADHYSTSFNSSPPNLGHSLLSSLVSLWKRSQILINGYQQVSPWKNKWTLCRNHNGTGTCCCTFLYFFIPEIPENRIR